MNSIRTRLFLILMLTTGVVWISAAAWISLSTQAQVQRVLDARLSEAARMVSSLLARQELAALPDRTLIPDMVVSHPSYDRQLACQIWALDGTLVSHSDGAPLQSMAPGGSGFSETMVNGEKWRVYAVENAELGMRVLVGDSLSVRDSLVADVIRGLAVPGLFILPVLAGLIWLSVRKGLAPLSSLARSLESRSASDLSALKESGSSSEIAPMVRSLNGLFARVEAARERERDFTAFAAHELRTPIAGLKTQAQVALANPDQTVRENALRQISVGVNRTARLIRQLTDLTNAESGEFGGEDNAVCVGSALEAVAEDIARHHPQKPPIVLAEELLPVTLSVNGSLFMLTARNLLENAVLHSPPGRSVNCWLQRDEGAVVVGIDDAGPGIPDDELHKVRDRFFRGRNKTSMGSGLGLAIAEMALKRVGGELHLENRPEGGLRAKIRLPGSAVAANACASTGRMRPGAEPLGSLEAFKS